MLRNCLPLLLRCFPVLFLTFSVLLLLASGVRAESTQSFSSGSLEQIVSSREAHPFIIIFWSLDCHSCLSELDFLSKQLNLHPEMDLVMVSTDAFDRQDAVEMMLAKHHLDTRIESWIFSKTSVQKLRYEIDPGWYGELPRSYFYDAEHQRKSLSGIVTEAHFMDWRSVKNQGLNRFVLETISN